MNEITFTIDGVEVKGKPGQTIMQAADDAGIYICRLCYHPEIHAHGSCRVCTVIVNGKPQTACTQPITEGMIVENETRELNEHRRNLVDMLFIEGNHLCMFCERSGNCELQAVAYRLGILAPKYPYFYPDKPIDATHKDIFLELNRCILCGRCVNASKDIDKKSVFGFINRGINKLLNVNSEKGLGGTNMAVTDKAADFCPVGAINKKHTAFAIPIGKRLYDTDPIGSDIENKNK
ncbi:MAG: 2Fe-2S iron-sulfur cluster-binding protein [Phycisphaerales bacterium]